MGGQTHEGLAVSNIFDIPAIPGLPNSSSVVFDLESLPCFAEGSSSLDEDSLIAAAKDHCIPLGIDFDEASVEHPGEFDPSTIKVGNLKDQSKIDAKIEAARKQHESLASRHRDDVAAAERKFWLDVIQMAPLSPALGKVGAVGYCIQGEIRISDYSERELLSEFWHLFESIRANSNIATGWNIHGFDVPFILARSAIQGVEIPRGVFERGKWLSQVFVDLMPMWGRHFDPWKQSSGDWKAKNVAKTLGASRPDSVLDDGAKWWRYWLGEEAEREDAIEYLEWDVAEETLIAERLGVI